MPRSRAQGVSGFVPVGVRRPCSKRPRLPASATGLQKSLLQDHPERTDLKIASREVLAQEAVVSLRSGEQRLSGL